MLTHECAAELRSSWLPNLTDAGLSRLIDLLDKQSPMLIQGCFTRAVPMGCLASHAAWNHPATEHLLLDAGINWLHRVAHLNPATSVVIREWDSRAQRNFEFRAEVFNISNTPPLNDPNGSFGSAAFGTITSAGNPRDVEFAGKIRF